MLPGPLAKATLRGEQMTSRGLRLYVCAMGVALSSTGRGGWWGVYISRLSEGWRVFACARDLSHLTLDPLSQLLVL